ncbi:MAG: DUF1858 domain-containing protein [Candidatus Hydrogenedentales bacterium]|jgi:hypothetical protein
MATADTATSSISPDTLIPELLKNSPQVRPILDRYGLRGCGGEHGPIETLAFFARAHDVHLDTLLRELREAAASAKPDFNVAESDPIADGIFRPFFKGGIAVVLTLGALWGAYLLVRIAVLGSFTAVGIHEVNAHGHAQIFGWVGLFVMGFAYQAFPRFKHTSLRYPKLALATFWLMITGIVLRAGAQSFLYLWPNLLVPGLLGSVLEVVAVGLFLVVIGATLRGSGKGLAPYDLFIISALGWFLVQAVYELIYFALTATAPDRDSLLRLVSTWQGPLRDIQIHGFILLMILGVSQRLFHYFYDLPAPSPRKSLIGICLLNMAVIGEATGFVLMRTGHHAWATLWYGAVLVLAGTVAWLVHDWRIFSPASDADRSLKFLRTAYVWLFVSLGMLVLLPAYQFGLLRAFAPDSQAAQIGFSHAYYGAIRHAITVGFASLMIMGVAAKVIPTLMGVDDHGLRPLWLPFALVNLGCFTRVSFQTLTDFSPSAFPLAGISGMMEVAGLAIWGFHLWSVMSGRVRERSTSATAVGHVAYTPGEPIAGSHVVGDVLTAHPQLLQTFIGFGFTPLANPILRAALAKRITIMAAAKRLDVDLDELLVLLNQGRLGTGHAHMQAVETLSRQSAT